MADETVRLTDQENGDLAAAYGWWRMHGDPSIFNDVLEDAVARLVADRLSTPAASDESDGSASELAQPTADPGEAWDKGYTAGHSIAMRRMSDEPNAPTPPNPYRDLSAPADTPPTADASGRLAPIVDFYHWWREQKFVVGSGEADRLRRLGDLLHALLTPANASYPPAWVAREYRHDDGRLCWYNAANDGWYTEEDRPGHLAAGGRPVCDDDHPADAPQEVHHRPDCHVPQADFGTCTCPQPFPPPTDAPRDEPALAERVRGLADEFEDAWTSPSPWLVARLRALLDDSAGGGDRG